MCPNSINHWLSYCSSYRMRTSSCGTHKWVRTTAPRCKSGVRSNQLVRPKKIGKVGPNRTKGFEPIGSTKTNFENSDRTVRFDLTPDVSQWMTKANVATMSKLQWKKIHSMFIMQVMQPRNYF